MTINNFSKKYHFLSNYHKVPVYYNGLTYKNSEAAYQAQKTLNPKIREKFTKLEPHDSKMFGQTVDLRPDWEQIKIGIMAEVVHQKFKQNPKLIPKLLETKDEELLEGNTWHDNCFGDCICPKCENKKGGNFLGKILMSEREYWKNKYSQIKQTEI